MELYKILFYFLYIKLSFCEDLSTSNLNLTIKLKVHYDIPSILKLDPKIMNKKHEYTARLKTDTENMFHRPAMSLPIHFDILYNNIIGENLKISQSDNAKTILENYCQWQETQKTKDNTWVSLLITGLDLYRAQTNPGTKRQKIFGISKPNSHCDNSRNCIVLHYNLYPSKVATVLAHEMSHSFGVNHDSTPECSGFYIMKTNHNPSKPLPDTWSKCSRNDFNTFLSSKLSSCIGDDSYRTALSKTNLPSTIEEPVLNKRQIRKCRRRV